MTGLFKYIASITVNELFLRLFSLLLHYKTFCAIHYTMRRLFSSIPTKLQRKSLPKNMYYNIWKKNKRKLDDRIITLITKLNIEVKEIMNQIRGK